MVGGGAEAVVGVGAVVVVVDFDGTGATTVRLGPLPPMATTAPATIPTISRAAMATTSGLRTTGRRRSFERRPLGAPETRGVPGVGAAAAAAVRMFGGYHLASAACHHPGPRDTSLTLCLPLPPVGPLDLRSDCAS
jgi:hypothetical protein